MKITFTAPDQRRFNAALEGIHANTRPVMVNWAVGVGNQARRNAAAKGGRSFWQREVLKSVMESVTSERSAEVYSTSIIAEHAHTGGIIRPKNAKMLAIPLTDEAKRRWPREFPAGELFIIRRKNGDRDQAILARKSGTGIEALFVLKRETAPQAPRPWWPDDDVIIRIGNQTLEKYIKIQEAKFAQNH